jgi:steroid delta-isomerase-like uncharacterized protein
MKNTVKIYFAVLMASAMVSLSGCNSKGIPSDLKNKLDQYINYWNTGQFDGIEEVIAEDFEMIESPDYMPHGGINSFIKLIENTRTTYPDFKLEINETIYEKDKIAFIWTVSGTHKGSGEIAPTGRTIRGKGISVVHFREGKIKDEWLSNNNLQWLMQLGYTLVPPKADAPAE